ncbi:MAB_1171c family putative transporter [Streptomyces prasinus]|uniref:MAB_1171c family putative transporter n=1 Tax=Streptomyces prasinus TaxID=67345 RepID=UPI0039C89BE0
MNVLINYVSCGALWLGLLVRAPDLLRHRSDPYLRSLCAVLGLAGLCFFLGAPPTVGAINRLGGVPNLAAPLTYAAIIAYGAASQVLIVHWRGGPGVRRTARRWILAYTGVLAGVAVTFALGDAPVERRTDLDTYYATTPYLAQMIVLYLVAHLAAVTVTAVTSLRWARRVRGGLRAGLTLIGVGALCGTGYSAAKLVAVVARWFGRDWPALGTAVSPAAAGLGALLTVVGVLVPLVTPRVARWCRIRRTYTRLEPLERALDDLLVRRTLRLPRPRLASPRRPPHVAPDQHPQRAEPAGPLLRPGPVRPDPCVRARDDGRSREGRGRRLGRRDRHRGPGRGRARTPSAAGPRHRAVPRPGPGAGRTGPDRRRPGRHRTGRPGAPGREGGAAA